MNQEHTEQKDQPSIVQVAKAKSKGEKLFDRTVYGGLAGVATFLVTVPIAYELENHRVIKPKFERAVAAVVKLFEKLPFKVKYDTSRDVVRTTTLMQGGNLMLLPVWAAEHFKVPIVRGLNAMLGERNTDEKIQEAPKQTAVSLIKSRALAWLAVFSSFKSIEYLYPNSLQSFIEETGKNVCRWLRRPEQRLNAGKILEDTRTFGYGKTSAIDFFATIAAATLLYVGGHFFARKQAEKKSNRLEGFPRHRADMLAQAPQEALQVSPSAETASQITGPKMHEGRLAETALQQQLS